MSKREKHVFDTSEIPHLWAHKVQDSARNAQGNLYFDGDTIYSYGSHFPIARHVTNAKGRAAVLLTTRSYSSTTAGHVSAVRSSIPPDVPVFEVHNPGAFDSGFSSVHLRNDGLTQRDGAVRDYISRINEHLTDAAKRRYEQRREFDLQAARRDLEGLRAFAEFFGFKLPAGVPKIPKVDERKLVIDKEREAAADAKRSAIRTAKNRERNAQWEAENKAREEDNARTLEDRLTRWYAGEYIWNKEGFPDYPMLRLKDGEVETSMGAKVPAARAWMLWTLVRSVTLSGTPWIANGHIFQIGHYTVERIDADGTLHAGCHVIPYAEMQRFAPILESAMQSQSVIGNEATPRTAHHGLPGDGFGEVQS